MAALEQKRTSRGPYTITNVENATEIRRDVVSIGLGKDRAYIEVYDTSIRPFMNSLIPKPLHNKLNGRQPYQPAPALVAIGTHQRYFVQFADGDWLTNGPDYLVESLNSTGSKENKVKSLAFGYDYFDYFVVYENGGFSHNGLTKAQSDETHSRFRDPGFNTKLSCVAMGQDEDGDLYIGYEDGRSYWWGLMHVRKYLEKTRNVKSLTLGPDWQWIIRYS